MKFRIEIFYPNPTSINEQCLNIQFFEGKETELNEYLFLSTKILDKRSRITAYIVNLDYTIDKDILFEKIRMDEDSDSWLTSVGKNFNNRDNFLKERQIY